MRLLCFAQQFKTFTSGLGTYARALVTELARRGHEVTLASPRQQCEAVEGVRLVPMAFAPGNITPFTFVPMALGYRRALRAEAGAHDVVHFLDAREAIFARGIGRPSAGSLHDAYALDWCTPSYPRHVHDDRALRGAYYAWLRVIERAAYRVPARFAANSAHVRTTVAQGYGVPERRIDVVPIGLPQPPPTAAESLSGAPAILFVGGNFQRKGLWPLLQAFARLSRPVPGARLHIVGGDPRHAAFRRRARELGVAGSVVFYGWQPNDRVRAMMAGASVFVMPSLTEAFGLVYLEAMWANTPVIASAAGGTQQAFRDGDDALLVPPRDVDALAAALDRVSQDAALRERLVAGGRAAIGRFTIEATVTRTEEVYAAAMTGGGRRSP
jgi:glycosyltransferase involved in cell wall biosynthesis